MSHEILKEDKLVFTGATPWHGLGVYLDPKASFVDWMKTAQLDWTINISPVMYTDENGVHRSMPNRFVMHRSDSGTALSIASERFKPVQPRTIIDFFRDLVATQGFRLETVGTLKNGKYIWGLAKVGKMAFIDAHDNVDPIRAYLLLSTICQPGFATTARFTSVRVVCNNTLQYALLDGNKNAVRIPHIEDFDSAAVKKALGLGVSSFEQFILKARELAAAKITNEEALDFFLHVAGDPLLEPEDPRQSTTVVHMQRAFTEYPGIPGLHTTNGTLWGALNVVTRHVDFARPNRGVGGRLTSAWFGSGARTKEHAWNIAGNFARTGSFAGMLSETAKDAPELSLS